MCACVPVCVCVCLCVYVLCYEDMKNPIWYCCDVKKEKVMHSLRPGVSNSFSPRATSQASQKKKTWSEIWWGHALNTDVYIPGPAFAIGSRLGRHEGAKFQSASTVRDVGEMHCGRCSLWSHIK